MSTVLVAEDSANNMIGPYLSTHAMCPFCNTKNEFIFIESRSSPVKAVAICGHIRARILDDEGINQFEFDDNIES